MEKSLYVPSSQAIMVYFSCTSCRAWQLSSDVTAISRLYALPLQTEAATAEQQTFTIRHRSSPCVISKVSMSKGYSFRLLLRLPAWHDHHDGRLQWLQFCHDSTAPASCSPPIRRQSMLQIWESGAEKSLWIVLPQSNTGRMLAGQCSFGYHSHAILQMETGPPRFMLSS